MLEEQRNNLGQAGKRNHGNAQDDQQANIGFNHLVRKTGTFLGHLCSPYAVADAGPIKAGSRASGLYSGTTGLTLRSEEHTSELQSLMRISYAVFCLKNKK